MAGEDKAREYVTRDELLTRLADAGVEVGVAQLRRYQAAGITPKPRRFGRRGAGRGVDWGWPREQAARVVRQLQLLVSGVEGAEEFARLAERYPAVLECVDALVAAARRKGYDEGREAAFVEMMEGTL